MARNAQKKRPTGRKDSARGYTSENSGALRRIKMGFRQPERKPPGLVPVHYIRAPDSEQELFSPFLWEYRKSAVF
jgi:hypothetical protein